MAFTYIYKWAHTCVSVPHAHEYKHAQQMYQSVIVRPDSKGWYMAQQ